MLNVNVYNSVLQKNLCQSRFIVNTSNMKVFLISAVVFLLSLNTIRAYSVAREEGESCLFLFDQF